MGVDGGGAGWELDGGLMEGMGGAGHPPPPPPPNPKPTPEIQNPNLETGLRGLQGPPECGPKPPGERGGGRWRAGWELDGGGAGWRGVPDWRVAGRLTGGIWMEGSGWMEGGWMEGWME